MIHVHQPESAIELAIAESLLEAHGIPYFVHNRGYGGLYPGIQVDLINRRTIFVPPSAADWARDVLSEYLSDSSGLRANRERSLRHVLRLIVEALCMGWCVPRIGNPGGKATE